MNTYTVREPGQSSWADGIKTLAQAVRERDKARDAGLSRAVIIAHTPKHESPIILQDSTVERLLTERSGSIGALSAAEYQDRGCC